MIDAAALVKAAQGLEPVNTARDAIMRVGIGPALAFAAGAFPHTVRPRQVLGSALF